MSLVSSDAGILLWKCDLCLSIGAVRLGLGLPDGWESRGDRTFCGSCVELIERNSQPRASTSCDAVRRSDPARQDSARLMPTGPRRDRVWISILLAFAAAFGVIALVLFRRIGK